MSNLLLITDVARLQKIFGRLTDDKNIQLRVVNNLEKGGEEIAIEKPDLVFVQTYLSGISADILLMHLKRQLGRKRSRFVLLATPAQTNDAILKQYQGWLDTSLEDNQLFQDLQQLISTLLNSTNKLEKSSSVNQEQIEVTDEISKDVVSMSNTVPISDDSHNKELISDSLTATLSTKKEDSSEDEGISYPPRQKLKVYSDFNISFDSAVSNTQEPETIEQATPPPLSKEWNIGDISGIDSLKTKPARSKKWIFIFWLFPIIIGVVIITYFQQQKPVGTPKTVTPKTTPLVAVKSVTPIQPPISSTSVISQKKMLIATIDNKQTSTSKEQDKITDKAVLTAISEKPEKKTVAIVKSYIAPMTTLPKFIPIDGLDKKYGESNPGWELYMGEVTEFRVLKKGNEIRAIQIIDRGWRGISEKFMQRIFSQVTNHNPVLIGLTSENKDGYKIKRAHIADNLKVVYYHEEQGGKLRALVLTWQ